MNSTRSEQVKGQSHSEQSTSPGVLKLSEHFRDPVFWNYMKLTWVLRACSSVGSLSSKERQQREEILQQPLMDAQMFIKHLCVRPIHPGVKCESTLGQDVQKPKPFMLHTLSSVVWCLIFDANKNTEAPLQTWYKNSVLSSVLQCTAAPTEVSLCSWNRQLSWERWWLWVMVVALQDK